MADTGVTMGPYNTGMIKCIELLSRRSGVSSLLETRIHRNETAKPASLYLFAIVMLLKCLLLGLGDGTPLQTIIRWEFRIEADHFICDNKCIRVQKYNKYSCYKNVIMKGCLVSLTKLEPTRVLSGNYKYCY